MIFLLTIEFITLISLLLIFYAYFGYPLLLLFFIKNAFGNRPQAPDQKEQMPPVTVIIAARNEEAVIAEKLDNTLALKYAGTDLKTLCSHGSTLVQVIVASDASDDETDRIVSAYADAGVTLSRSDHRGGKEEAQRLALSLARGELVFFTDAKISLNAEALREGVKHFVDPRVGAISSIDKVLDPADADAKGSGEGLYVRYEMWLRDLESQFFSLVGLSGSAFMVRRALTENLPTDIPSDFSLLLEAQRRGLIGRHAPGVIGSYRAVKSEEEEFSRKVRTVLRGITTLFLRKEVLNPARFGVFSWQMLSHKLARWLVPWCLVFSGLGLLVLSFKSAVYALMFLGYLSFFALAFLGFRDVRLRSIAPIRVALFFSIANLAILMAWVRYFGGARATVWDPSRKC